MEGRKDRKDERLKIYERRRGRTGDKRGRKRQRRKKRKIVEREREKKQGELGGRRLEREIRTKKVTFIGLFLISGLSNIYTIGLSFTFICLSIAYWFINPG